MNSVNSFFRTTIDDLVQKRLWPVAAVLLVALVAIPVLLANPADEQPASRHPIRWHPRSVPAARCRRSSRPSTRRARSRARSARTSRASTPRTPSSRRTSAAAEAAPRAARSRSRRGDASASGAGARPTRRWPMLPALGTSGRLGPIRRRHRAPTPAATTTPQTFYYTYAADVRFGKEGNLDRKTLSQFRSLPSSQDPVVVFMGVKEDGETAIFLQSSAPRRRPARATASPTTPAPSST